MAQLLADTTGNHDGSLCASGAGNVDGFDWQYRGRVNNESGPSQFTAWGTYQWLNCGQGQANTMVQFRDLRVYALTTGGWHHYAAQNDPFNWCWNRYPDTTTGDQGACERAGSDGYVMPMGALSGHWSEATDAVAAGDICHLVFIQAKKQGPGEVMANTGFDWRNGNSSAGDSWFGSYRRLTTAWRWIGGTSCTATHFAVDRPPLP